MPGLTLRHATPDDVRAMLGSDIDPEYCITRPYGYAAEREGELIATGVVTWDTYGRAWGWFNNRARLPAIMMHRSARAMLRLLREAEEPALYTICNLAIPGAEQWLRRLGFVHDETLRHPWGPVYRCTLI